MKWEDTVMDYELKLCHSLIGKYSLFAIKDVVDEECLAQAEISFKAGREEGFTLAKVTDPVLLSKTEHEELNRRARAFLDDVRLSGIKEVVEWIREQQYECKNLEDAAYGWLLIPPGEWQDQLKKWEL